MGDGEGKHRLTMLALSEGVEEESGAAGTMRRGNEDADRTREATSADQEARLVSRPDGAGELRRESRRERPRYPDPIPPPHEGIV